MRTATVSTTTSAAALAIAPAPVLSGAATLASSEERGWDGFGATLLRITAGRHAVPGQVNHRLGMHVGAPVRAVCRCDGQRSAGLQSHGDINLVPAGIDGAWTDDADCTLLSIWFSESFVQRTIDALGLASSHARVRPRLRWRDKRIEYLALALLADLESDDTCNALYAESLCTALIVRSIAGGPAAPEIERRSLAPNVARRVVDYIDTHLDKRLTLSDIAAVAGISVPHLKVLFHGTTGMPVHQYIVRQRTDRAKSLLLQGSLSISQVALEAGFAHQSHMAHWIKRILGTTPSEIARTRDV